MAHNIGKSPESVATAASTATGVCIWTMIPTDCRHVDGVAAARTRGMSGVSDSSR